MSPTMNPTLRKHPRFSKDDYDDDINTITNAKRLRGGGYNDDDIEECYDDDNHDDIPIDPPDDYFPDETENNDDDNNYNVNQSSNLSWTDQTDTAIHYSQLSPQQYQKWARKPLPKDFDNKRDIHFQWLDIDMTNAPQPLKKNPNSKRDRVVGAQEGTVPLIRVYGVTDEGYSIVTFLHGYTPYGYFALPEGYDLEGCDDEEKKNEGLGKIRMRLNDLLRQDTTTQRGGDKSKETDAGDLVQGVQYINDCKSIMGYNSAHTKFLKVYVQTPTLVPKLKRIMEDGVTLPHIIQSNGGASSTSIWDDSGTTGKSYQPFECNVPFVLRFMIDEDVNGAGWITLPKETYQLRTEAHGTKSSHCQVSYYCFYLAIFYSPQSLKS